MVQKNEHLFEKMNLTPLGIAVLSWLARNPDKEFYVREVTEAVHGTNCTILYNYYRINLSKLFQENTKCGKGAY